jgi:ATP-dependent DNA helicase RecG
MNIQLIRKTVKSGESETTKETGIIEKYGSGIKRIIQSFINQGLKSPEFKEIGDGFMITVFKNAAQKTTQKSTQKSTQKNLPISILSRKIIETIIKNKHTTQNEIAKELSISINTVKEYVKKLKMKEIIKHTGSDRAGYWEITKDNYD